MTATNSDILPFPIHHAVRVLALATLLPLVIVAVVLLAIGQTGMLSMAVLTGLSCLVAALVALEPMRIAGRVAKTMDKVTLAALLAIVVRLGLTLTVVAVVISLANFEVRVAALWALGWYLIMLVAEVMVFLQYFKMLINHAEQAKKNDRDAEVTPC